MTLVFLIVVIAITDLNIDLDNSFLKTFFVLRYRPRIVYYADKFLSKIILSRKITKKSQQYNNRCHNFAYVRVIRFLFFFLTQIVNHT